MEQIRQAGIDALRRHLGLVDMIRFLQQAETGWGDYTHDRAQWLGDPPLADLFNAIKGSEPDTTTAGH